MIIIYAPAFIRDYKNLEPGLKEEIQEAISLFVKKENQPKPKIHKLNGIKNTFSFSVNYKIRIIFEYKNKNMVNLLRVGTHDKVYE